jgi:hypothetical protein
MRNPTTLAGSNCRLARQKWALKREDPLLKSLRTLSEELQVSVASGDLSILQNDWYVIHTGLIRLARRKRCAGIHAEPSQLLSDPSMGRWAFKATVYKSRTCKGFVGYGDADPSNVSPLVRGAEMRVAETRAVNRALRKAYGIGICSVEEIGSFAGTSASVPSSKKIPPQPVNGHSQTSGPLVRDRLCQLIRQHQLDPNLVKAYAVDFCGTKALREATREQVENFVVHLADWAAKRSQRPALPAQQLHGKQRRCLMTRRFQGLGQTAASSEQEVPDGVYLVRVEKAQYRWHAQKPFYFLRLSVLEPQELTGRQISGRLYCTAKALWKLGWFLRDFTYDPELLGRDEVDEMAMPGLSGVVKISHTVVNGTTLINFDGFAPASQWQAFSGPSISVSITNEVNR